MKQIRLFLLGLVFAIAGTTQAANTLKVADIEVAPGESVVLSIELENDNTNLMGWQCDIVLPEGLTLKLKANGKPAATLGDRFATTEHSISSSILANGAYRFIATSMDGDAIPGTTGTLFTVTVQADASLAERLRVGDLKSGDLSKTHRPQREVMRAGTGPAPTLAGKVTNIEFNTQDNQKLTLDDVTIAVTIPSVELPKCAIPTISYGNDEISFDCETEGAEFIYEIADTDIGLGNAVKVALTKTYTITVYAKKEAYENSDVATATLTWIDVEARTGDLTTGVNEVQALPVLIQAINGLITVTGADDGMKVEAFGLDGVQAGSAYSYNGTATVSTTLQTGSVAIVKIGEKNVKVTIK